VLRGKDAAGANLLLQALAKAADILQLDGVRAVKVRLLWDMIFILAAIHCANSLEPGGIYDVLTDADWHTDA
jgi:hypothetical protein